MPARAKGCAVLADKVGVAGGLLRRQLPGRVQRGRRRAAGRTERSLLPPSADVARPPGAETWPEDSAMAGHDPKGVAVILGKDGPAHPDTAPRQMTGPQAHLLARRADCPARREMDRYISRQGQAPYRRQCARCCSEGRLRSATGSVPQLGRGRLRPAPLHPELASCREGYLFESPVMAGFACAAFMPGSNWRTCARWLAMLSFWLVRSSTSRSVAARRRPASA